MLGHTEGLPTVHHYQGAQAWTRTLQAGVGAAEPGHSPSLPPDISARAYS